MKAKSILRQEFETNPGRGGDGAYFWTAFTDEQLELSVLFAQEWMKRRHPYASCDVVVVDVEAAQDEVISLDDPELHLDLRSLLIDAVKKHCKVESVFDVSRDDMKAIEKKLFGIIEEYILRLERQMGQPIKVVFKSQIPPVKDPLREIVGLAPCFAIRANSCIKDKRIH